MLIVTLFAKSSIAPARVRFRHIHGGFVTTLLDNLENILFMVFIFVCGITILAIIP